MILAEIFTIFTEHRRSKDDLFAVFDRSSGLFYFMYEAYSSPSKVQNRAPLARY